MALTFILHRPLFAGNVGSVARAMKNMGFSDLRLVSPQAFWRSDEARKMAAHAGDVLEQARLYEDLPSALQSFDFVVGTSRRRGKDRANWTTPREFAASCRSLPSTCQIAVLFGPEDCGLQTEEIQLCQALIAIPSDESCPSLNLAQAAMVIAYELKMASLESGSSPQLPQIASDDGSASWKELEAMYRDWEGLLLETGFLDKKNPQHLMRLFRNLLNRARMTRREMNIFRGMVRQLRWWKSQ